MNIEVIAFGIAKDILKSKSVSLSLEEGSSVGKARQTLVDQYPQFETLA